MQIVISYFVRGPFRVIKVAEKLDSSSRRPLAVLPPIIVPVAREIGLLTAARLWSGARWRGEAFGISIFSTELTN